MGAMIREGWNYVTRHPIMGPCMWDATATNFVCGGQMALFALNLVHDLAAPAALVGFLLVADGIRSLLSAALASSVIHSVGSDRACLLASVVSVAGAFLIPVGHGAFVCPLVGVPSPPPRGSIRVWRGGHAASDRVRNLLPGNVYGLGGQPARRGEVGHPGRGGRLARRPVWRSRPCGAVPGSPQASEWSARSEQSL